jgi:GDSL-like Lipase/Acylhydrolase family
VTVRGIPLPIVLMAALLAACGRAGADDPAQPAASREPTHVFRSAVPSLSTLPEPCPSSTPVVEAGVEVTLYDAPNGGCIAEDQLRGFRCGERVDPIIEAAGLRFVGGRFAMMVAGLPAASQLVARGGGQEIYVAPGDRPTLFVRTGERIERWLTLVEHFDGPPQARFLGDSIMLGSRGAVVRALAGWGTAFRAEVGRTTAEGVEVAKTFRDVWNDDVVVVELGTNDSTPDGFPDRIQQVLSLVDGARLVVWVTVHRDMSFVPELNADIVRAMAALPNGAVVDWASEVAPEDIVSDGVHPSDAGKEHLAGMLGFLMNRWEETAAGRGALECEPPPG